MVIYTRKDFKMSRILAIALTFLYFIVHILYRLIQIVEFTETVKVITFFLDKFFPFLVVLGWYMCLERYFYLEFGEERSPQNKNDRIRTYIGIKVMIILGILVFYYAQGTIFFTAWHWNCITEIYDCVAVRLTIMACWIFCLIYSIKRRTAIAVPGGVKKGRVALGILFLFLLAILSLAGTFYACFRAESVRLEKMVAYHHFTVDKSPLTEYDTS